MMIRISIFLIFPLLIASALWAEDKAALIRQVVDGGDHDRDDESWLTAMNPHRLRDEHRFSLFKAKFNKSYASQEEQDYRFDVFRSNMRHAARNQELDPTAIHGVTQFSDLTEDEFKERFLGIQEGEVLELPEGVNNSLQLPSNFVPANNFDWRDKGAVTPRREPGVTAAGVSPQLELWKNGGDTGCCPGSIAKALKYIRDEAGGIMLEKDYPFTSESRTCKSPPRGEFKFDKTKIEAKVASYSSLKDPNQYAATLEKNGPLAGGINLMYLRTYVSGVTCPHDCPIEREHAVLLVGYGKGTSTEKPYWIVKNSWGGKWGESGYFRICSGTNVCGIETRVITVTAAKI